MIDMVVIVAKVAIDTIDKIKTIATIATIKNKNQRNNSSYRYNLEKKNRGTSFGASIRLYTIVYII